MTGLGHPDDDRLLELAYGELAAAEADPLRRHLDGCPRCREVLEGIAEVRMAVRRVPPPPAPERGLESLLAYGEQAAARARGHRRNVQWLGLLTLATAAGLAWVLLPQRQERVPAASEPMARVDQPVPPAQGDRAASSPAEAAADPKAEARAKLGKQLQQLDVEAKRAAALAELTKERHSQQGQLRRTTMDERDTARAAGAVAEAPAAPPPTDDLARAEPARAESKKAESASAESEARARTAPAPAKVAAATPAATPPPASVVAGSPATGSVGRELEKGNGAGRVDVGSSSVTGLLGGIGAAGGVAADKSDSAFAQSSAGAKDAQNRAASAPAPKATAKPGADRATREARLAEVRRSVAAASGDARKALLLEQCRLEASLELRASAVGTCSQVAREFPGTKEAQQAVELARGFSVQVPPPPDR